MHRDNHSWLIHLRVSGAPRDAALADLRADVLRGLRGALSRRSLPDPAFLEDVAQEALLKILERLDQFECRSRFVTWAIAIAVRVAMSELRRRRWRDVSLDALVADGDLRAERVTRASTEPAASCDRHTLLDALHDVMRVDLTEKQRHALVAELKGMPQEEIARHLGSNRNAVYKLTHDARKRLKRGLERAGYHASDVRDAFTD